MTKSVKRDGVALSYQEAGKGDPTLIFVHGWCCDGTHFAEQVRHFATAHRAIAVDLRGHGSSDKPDQDYTIPAFVDDLTWLCSELDVDKPVVVGHSMGGTIALSLVREHPDLARAIIMIDAPILEFSPETRALGEQVVAALQTSAYQDVAAGYARTSMFNAKSPPALVDRIVRGISAAPQRLMHTAILSVLDPESAKPGPIEVPALFIRSATSPSEAEYSKRFPDLQVAAVEAPHFLQIEKPTETNRVIEAFLSSLMT